MSSTQENGLSISVSYPLWGAVSSPALGVGDITAQRLGEYSHEIGASGGFLTAEFTLAESQSNVEQWLERIGYHVQVKSPAQSIIWDGFVNEVEVQIGALTIKRGPMLDIGNHVAVAYQTVSYNTNPPIGGEQSITSYADDAISQEKYGVLETIVSGGTGLAAEMTALRDTYLAEYSMPETSQTVSVGAQGAAAVRVSCVGYVQLTNRYYYTESGTGTENISTKIGKVLADSPSVTFDTTGISANTIQVPVFSDGQSAAAGEIANLVARGDSSDNRYLFGVYAGQKAIYKAAPTTVYYDFAVNGKEQIVTLAGGNAVVYPWDVAPGRWMLVSGVLVGQTVPADLRTDPRAIFIESVRYTMPWGLELTGGKVGKFSQKLAKLGLGGI